MCSVYTKYGYTCSLKNQIKQNEKRRKKSIQLFCNAKSLANSNTNYFTKLLNHTQPKCDYKSKIKLHFVLVPAIVVYPKMIMDYLNNKYMYNVHVHDTHKQCVVIIVLLHYCEVCDTQLNNTHIYYIISALPLVTQYCNLSFANQTKQKHADRLLCQDFKIATKTFTNSRSNFFFFKFNH